MSLSHLLSFIWGAAAAVATALARAAGIGQEEGGPDEWFDPVVEDEAYGTSTEVCMGCAAAGL
jgi:hypothetical protein